jgi:pyridoxamine 5'-phosphate oxidase
VFFTNYESRKGLEMQENSHVALNFFWSELERQVRVIGIVKKSSKELSDLYFQSRPENSRVGAWSSPQSKGIPNREWLEDQEQAYSQKFVGKDIPRPEYWGGYVVEPYQLEFWQGRTSRLHDRIQYTKINDIWSLERLAP